MGKMMELKISESFKKMLKVNMEWRIEEFMLLFGTRALENLLNGIFEYRGIKKIKLKGKRN